MVYLLLADGFEEIEAITPCDLLRRAGVDAKLVGVGGGRIRGSHGIAVETDLLLEEAAGVLPEMVVLPGGRRGVDTLLASPAALDLVKRCWQAGKYVAAICAAPTLLAKLCITDGCRATCYPGMESQMGPAQMQNAAAVRDGRLITGRSAGCSMQFALALVDALCGEHTARKISEGVVFPYPDDVK